MKIRRLLLVLLVVVLVYVGGRFILKNYLFPFKHQEEIVKYSKEYNLDPYLVLAVIKAESKFTPDAESHKGARGLMQITPDTGEWIAQQMGIEDYNEDMLYDEEMSIRMGSWYLDNLREEFGTFDNYIAAYNAGRGNVNKWLNNKEYSQDGETLSYIPFKETKKYVDRVNSYYEIYKSIY